MNKILVAEDDTALNFLVTTSLNDSGYQAVSCKDGKRGLEELEKGGFSWLRIILKLLKLINVFLVRSFLFKIV